MNTLKTTLLAVSALSGALLATSHAQTFDAVADTYVTPGSADSNFGGESRMVVLNDGGTISKTKDFIGLVRFEVGSQLYGITSATFSINGRTDSRSPNAEDNYQLYGIPDLGDDENFDELSITFNTFAYGTTSMNGSIDLSGLTLLGNFTGEAPISLSSSELVDFLNADTNGLITFVIYKVDNDGVFTDFYTRESTQGGPTLTLNTIPEPSDFALMAGVLGLFFVIRRRKAA